jgi:PAS domain S-box-containing protein
MGSITMKKGKSESKKGKTKKDQITERIEVEKDLLQALMEGQARSKICIDIVSKDHKILLQNQILQKRFGSQARKLCHETYLNRKEPCDDCPMAKSIKSKKVERTELIGADGRSYEVISAPLINSDGKVDKVIEVILDITERKRADESLQFQSLLLDQSSELIISSDLNGKISYANQAIANALGKTPQELIGKSVDSFPEIPDDISNIQVIKKTFSDGHWSGQRIMQLKDGTKRFIDLYTQLINDVDGNPNSLFAIGHDITERKEAEDALRESEERYKALSERTENAIYINDFEGNFLDANDTALNILGYKKKDITKLNFASLLHDDQLDRAIETTMNLLETGKTQKPTQYKLKRKDGEYIWIETEGSVLYKNGEPYAIQGIAKDITERKLAEEKLRQSEEKFREIVENINDVIYRIDKTGMVNYVSPSIKGFLGYNPSEIVGQPFRKFIYDRDLPRLMKNVQKILTGEKADNEYRILTKSGDIRWIHTSSRPIMIEGKIIGLQGVLSDITERKLAEEALHESEAKFRNIVQASPMGMHMYELNPEGQLMFTGANPAADSILGIDNNQFIGKTISEAFPTSADTEIPKMYTRAAKTGKPWDTEQINYQDDKVQGAFEVHAFQTSPGKMVTTFLDITERKQTETALRESEYKFRSIVEQSSDGITLLDEKGIIKEWNQAQEQISGLKKEEVMGKPFWDILNKTIPKKEKHRGRYQQIKSLFTDFFKTGKAHWLNNVAERRIQRPDGAIRVIESLVFPITSTKGKMLGSISRDITEKKQAEDALRESQERYSSLFSSTNEGVALHEIIYNKSRKPIDYKILDVNPAYERILGIKRKDAIGTKASILYKTGEAPYLMEFVKVVETGEPTTFEATFEPMDKAFKISVFSPAEGQFATLFADITDRKRAEEELKQSEIRFRSMIEQTTDAVFCYEYDPPIPTDIPVKEQIKMLYKGTLVECNDVCARSYGAKKAQQVIGKKLIELFGTTPGSLDGLYKTFIENDYKTVDQEAEEIMKDGTKRYFLNNGYGVIENGKLIRVWGTFRDISKRKNAEKSLQESEEKFRTLFELSPFSTVYSDLKGNIITCNQQFTKTHATKGGPEAQVGKDVSKFFPKEEWPHLFSTIENTIKNGKTLGPVEYTMLREDGTKFISEAMSTVIKDQNGKPIALLANAHDITKRKKAEEALQISEEKYRELVENINDVIYIVDKHGIDQYISPAIERVTGGFKPSDLEGQIYNKYIHPDDVERISKEFKVRLSGKSGTVEYRTNTKTGEILWLRDSSRPITKDGKIIGIQGVLRDITERKRTEEALQESEEKYRNLVERANDGIVIVQDGLMKFSNTRLAKILGYTVDEIQNTPFLDYVYPSERSKIKDIFYRRIKDEAVPGIYEMAGLNKDGSKIDIETNSGIISYNGKPAVLSFIRDITERKLAEEALRESEEKHSTMVEHANDGVVIVQEGSFVFINEAAARIAGYSYEELLNKPFMDILAPEDKKEVAKRYQARVAGKAVEPTSEFKILAKNGKPKDIELSAALIRYQGLPATMGVFRDITERKQSEEALKNAKEFTDAAIDAQIDTFFVFDPETGKPIKWNKVFRETSGYTDSEIESMKAPNDWYDKQDLKKAINVGKEILKGAQVTLEMDLITKNGTRIPTEYTGSTIKDENGKPKYIVAIGRDITERKRIEEQTLQQRDLGQALSAMTNLKEAAAVCVETAINATGMDAGGVYLADKNSGNLDLIYSKGLSKDFIKEASHYDNKSQSAKLVMAGKPIYTLYPKMKLPPDSKKIQEGLHALGVIPITHEDKVIGCLNIASHSLDEISIHDQHTIEAITAQIGSAIARLQAEEALRESEKRFRGIAERSHDIIFTMDQNMNVVYVSPAMEKILGFLPERYTGKNPIDFIPDSEMPRAHKVFKKLAQGNEIEGFEVQYFKKDDSSMYLEINVNPISEGKKIKGYQGIIRDITTRKRAEEEMKRRLMKFKLEEGNVYLVQEDSPTLTFETVNDLQKVGYTGLVLSRTPLKEVTKRIKGDFNFYWLSEKEGENTLSPNLNEIHKLVEALPKRKVILVDRMDYLISKHGFKKVLDFVQQLKDIAVISNHIIITSIDPSTIVTKELRLLEKESEEVELTQMPKLPEHLLEIIRFIYHQNTIGLKPSHSDICKETRISKPTARKRIRHLTSAGYVIEGLKGRNKIVELTEKGKGLFSQ